jgi:signal transduction histidine kinase/FixJ family two-component response regulator/HAMP domain-containing protein
MPGRSGPISQRLMSIMLLTSAAAIALACLGFGGYEYYASRNRLEDQLSTLARIIAANSTAALAFQDERDAVSVLSALKSEPNITMAALYDANGALFVTYPDQPDRLKLPQRPGDEGFKFVDGFLQGFQPVRELEDQTLGALYIQADAGVLFRRFWLYALIATVVMAGSLLVAYVLSRLLQDRISGPIQSLADTARAVSERGDFTVRAPASEEGEFAVLTAAFNQMLSRIDTQSSALVENEQRLQTQLARLDLLQRTTRAIGERQDLPSIFQVILRNLEDNLPIDFGCVCLYDAEAAKLNLETIGARSSTKWQQLSLAPGSQLPIDENGLSRCVRGVLVYEPDTRQVPFAVPQRFSTAGLLSLVAAPLVVESKVFGVLLVARQQANAFSSGDCEFLRQLSEHVALASHQTQLYVDLQKAYDNLRVSQNTLLQQERLRALGQMASGVAHDINNAISPIALYTESLLEHELNLSDRARSYLRTIQRAITDVAQTVTRMREFYRQRDQESDLQPLDLNEMVDQALTLTRARWSDMTQERGVFIDVRTELAQGAPKVLGTESDIRDALTNLIFNAVDAMPSGGTLTVRTREVKRTGGVAGFALEVSDTGTGMDEETRRRCIEPFFTTKGERGTGMGLAMVYGMAKRQGAQIEIDSAVGQGTTIRIAFCIAGEQSGNTFDEPSLIVASTRQRLLVIDDDPLLREALFRILEGEGHEVTTMDGGQAGIDAFTEAHRSGQPFDAVMTDLGMPYVDGRSVAAAVKKLSPKTPVILLTGWGQRLNTEQSVPAHVDVLLSKPPKLPELRRTLAQIQKTAVAQVAQESAQGTPHA